MALKPDRDFFQVMDITNFWTNTTGFTTAEEGGIASVETGGSGVALGVNNTDDPNFVLYATVASGSIPKGVLLHPVNPPLSATRDFKNLENQESRPGDKVALLRKGSIVSNKIVGTPAIGSVAYLGASGYFDVTQTPSTGTGAAKVVGRFETTKDADGFARIFIDI